MLTVGSLLSDVGLKPVAGAPGLEREIRWVHISELDDPTPWLSGGELLLTTGSQLASPPRQREFVALLDEHGLAGLGLGTGFAHKRVPKALTDEAESRAFPLFEIPYEMPFIAITEHASQALVNQQYEVLERGIAVHERLERLVIEGRGLQEIITSIATAISGSALLIDSSGTVVASHSATTRELPEDAVSALAGEVAERSLAGRPGQFTPADGPLADRALVLPLPASGNSSARSWLALVPRAGLPTDLDRLIARQGSIVIALELMRERVVRETERRLAGDVLADALSGRLDSEELAGRLRPFGIEANAAVLLFEVTDPATAEKEVEEVLRERGAAALVATTQSSDSDLVCAVIEAAPDEPVEHARAARKRLSKSRSSVRASASRPAAVGALRRAFHEARCALEATSLANGDAPEVASHEDLGAFTLLLALQDDDALRLYSDSLLAPIEQTDGGYGGELLRSLEAFIEQNGQWERAARILYCHRHTLRYRIRRIEELTGRDLGNAHDRIELWLALRARELVR
jgi:purine catabolism regulator